MPDQPRSFFEHLLSAVGAASRNRAAEHAALASRHEQEAEGHRVAADRASTLRDNIETLMTRPL